MPQCERRDLESAQVMEDYVGYPSALGLAEPERAVVDAWMRLLEAQLRAGVQTQRPDGRPVGADDVVEDQRRQRSAGARLEYVSGEVKLETPGAPDAVARAVVGPPRAVQSSLRGNALRLDPRSAWGSPTRGRRRPDPERLRSATTQTRLNFRTVGVL
jgi:hypothetical protein